MWFRLRCCGFGFVQPPDVPFSFDFAIVASASLSHRNLFKYLNPVISDNSFSQQPSILYSTTYSSVSERSRTQREPSIAELSEVEPSENPAYLHKLFRVNFLKTSNHNIRIIQNLRISYTYCKHISCFGGLYSCISVFKNHTIFGINSKGFGTF